VAGGGAHGLPCFLTALNTAANWPQSTHHLNLIYIAASKTPKGLANLMPPGVHCATIKDRSDVWVEGKQGWSGAATGPKAPRF
jgi:hypothetical protein